MVTITHIAADGSIVIRTYPDGSEVIIKDQKPSHVKFGWAIYRSDVTLAESVHSWVTGTVGFSLAKKFTDYREAERVMNDCQSYWGYQYGFAIVPIRINY